MAYQDALFQLGMDLTRSSTAQEEDVVACDARAVVSKSEISLPRQTAEIGRFQDRMGSGIAGSHLVIDLFGSLRLDDADHIERTLTRCADLAGAQVRHVHLNTGTPAEGVSGFAALNGGHISIHTDPETGIAALDIFVRGDIKSGRTVEMLEKAFSASRVVVREHTRGDEQAVAQASLAMRRVPRGRSKVRKAA